MPNKKFPESFYNLTTIVGVAIALISFGLILFLIILETFATDQKPYMGIIAFVILPTFLIFGLILISYGILRESRKIKSGKHKEFEFPKIDLNNPKQFSAFIVFSVGTVLLLMFSAFGSYKAYEYTDSDEFCGEVCHEVMSPEYTAYQFSPHAKVGCAKCHIGSGAQWFVKAKISGSYQVYSVLFKKFSRPIPTPIDNLRPAQETCEKCHWPKHFYAEKKRTFNYYLSDENNSKFTLDMLMKIGGGNIESGNTSGIHWHMNTSNEVTFVATDEKRQVIPWVKSKNKDGVSVTYKSTDNLIGEKEFENLEVRRMDCIDCHNRPTHIYHPPSKSVNHYISIERINKSLPSIKTIAVTALENEYFTSKGALDSIKHYIENYYLENYPKLLKEKKSEIDEAIIQIQNIYKRNYFPEMRTNWKFYPNNIGHLYSNGCFRCHDGKHVDEKGNVLTKDCNACHSIIAQKFESGNKNVSVDGVKYQHPVDIGDSWDVINCVECHSVTAK